MEIQIYADGATLEDIEKLEDNNVVSGYTFNPSLLRKSGIIDFEKFAKEFIRKTSLPISLEVFSDDWESMEREAIILSDWGENIFVKIPPMTTEGVKTTGLVQSLLSKNIKLNLTCIFTFIQIDEAIQLLKNTPNIISIFAGRIADAGHNPETFISYAQYNKFKNQQILWASTREIFNLEQAINSGADIITMGTDLIYKMLKLKNKDLYEYSLDTVKMFRNDAIASGFKI